MMASELLFLYGYYFYSSDKLNFPFFPKCIYCYKWQIKPLNVAGKAGCKKLG